MENKNKGIFNDHCCLTLPLKMFQNCCKSCDFVLFLLPIPHSHENPDRHGGKKKNFALSFVFINYPFKTVYLVKFKKKKKTAENTVNNSKI